MSPFLSLRAVIPLLLVLSTLLASLGGYLYERIQGVKEVEKRSIDTVKHSMNQLQSGVNIMLRREDLDGARIQLTSLTTLQDILYILIVDERGEVMLASSKDLEGKNIHEIDPVITEKQVLGENASLVFLSDDRMNVHAVYPVGMPDKQNTVRAMRTGYLIKNRDISNAKHLENITSIKQISSFIFIMLVMTIFVWGLFHYLITRRVDHLLYVTDMVSDGDFSKRSGLRGKDEFARLSRSLDNMAISLSVKQRELVASEERLRLSQEYANVGTWEWNIKTDEVYWSDTIYSLFHTDKEKVKTYEDFLGLVHPEDVESVRTAVQRCVEFGEKYDYQHRVVLDDGAERWMHEKGDVLRSPVDNSPLRMFGVVADITEQKKSDIKLLNLVKELNYQKYAMDQHAIVSITDLAGNITYVNDNFCRASGYSKEELIGKTHHLVKSGFHDRDFYQNMWETIQSGKNWRREMCNKSKAGEKYWVDTTIVPHFDESGQPDSYIAIRTDITDRIRANEQLGLQASALEAAADGIVITDKNGDMQWVNPAYTRLTGYGLEESVGKNQRILNSGKHDKAFFKDLWDTVLAKKMWHGELWNKRKDGSLYYEEESITPVLSEKGEIVNFIAIKRDVSERRKLQKQLQQAQKMEAIGQLTGGIAHDFNNMLASILGYTEISVEAMEKTDNDKVKGYLDQVYMAGCRARDLIAQMLAFSRGSEDEISLYALGPMMREVIVMLGSTLPSSIVIDIKIESDLLKVLTNPVQFHQMMVNLFINARDAMDGKGVITVGLKKTHVADIECCSCHEKISGDFVCFSVGDTGAGIEVEQLSNLFEPFYSTKDVGKGTGMGLSMVHGLIHQHGGHVLVESEPGKGSAFSLLFPVVEKNENINGSLVDNNNGVAIEDINGRVLIVDDDVSVAQFISTLLEYRGCDVTVENDSRLALSTFKNNPDAFDLVVTDQTMPGLTGEELANALLKICPDLSIILCTGFSDKIDEKKALSLGIKGYLEKPIQTERFLSLVQDLLKSRGVVH